jgi:hypothetical protein
VGRLGLLLRLELALGLASPQLAIVLPDEKPNRQQHHQQDHYGRDERNDLEAAP